MQQGPVDTDMNTSTLTTAKNQLRAVMKQRLANIPLDSITSQSRYLADHSVINKADVQG
jgi:hypothetical protein